MDVPPKLSARARVFATGQGRKTDATDAHSVALVATRMSGLRRVADDQQLAVLPILADRRRSLGEDHTTMVSQLHRLLLELIPGGSVGSRAAASRRASAAQVERSQRRHPRRPPNHSQAVARAPSSTQITDLLAETAS